MAAIEVTVTCASVEEAHSIIRAIIHARLAACGQTWPVESCYRWNDEVVVDQEHLVVLKTTTGQFDAISELIRSQHSYDLPAIAAVPVTATGPGYLEWLDESTAGPDGDRRA